MDIQFEIEGAEELQRALAEARKLARREMRGAVARSMRIMRQNAAPLFPSDTGAARRGLGTKVTSRGDKIRGVLGGSQPHTHLIIGGTGRQAGGKRHWPPATAARLVAWARKRGANPRDVAYFVARRGGIPGRDIAGPTVRLSEGQVQAELNAVYTRIMRALEG